MLLTEKHDIVFTITFDEESKKIIVDVLEDEDEA